MKFTDIFKKWYFYVAWAVWFFFQWMFMPTFGLTDLVISEIIGLLSASFFFVFIVYSLAYLVIKIKYEVLKK